MMKLWFDHQIFSVQQYGGYTRYYVSLARALRKQARMDVSIVAPAHLNELLRPSDPLHPATFKLAHPLAGAGLRPAAIALWFRLLAEAGRPDLVHETHHILSGWHVPKRCKVVATCHDMILERHANGSAASQAAVQRKHRGLSRADKIICVSKSTQQDLDHFYPELAKRSIVIHHGVSHRAAPSSVSVSLPKDFILFVGVRNAYKNFQRGLRAIAASSALAQGLDVVCFGGDPFNAEELALMAELHIATERVHYLQGDDDLLAYCYGHAKALFFPSEYEGFGMPLTEAMVLGCPIVCSAIPAFTEVCGDAAVYFEPTDIVSMRDSLEAVLSSEGERQRLGALGTRRGQDFSWQRCADATTACYLA